MLGKSEISFSFVKKSRSRKSGDLLTPQPIMARSFDNANTQMMQSKFKMCPLTERRCPLRKMRIVTQKMLWPATTSKSLKSARERSSKNLIMQVPQNAGRQSSGAVFSLLGASSQRRYALKELAARAESKRDDATGIEVY
jgi:hypothetical protein